MARKPKKKMNLFLRLLAWVAGIVFTLLIIFGSVLYWALTHPQDAWNFAERHFLPADLKVHWGEVSFKPEKITWLHYAIEWRVKGMSVTKDSPRISAPIDELGATFSFSVWKPATRIDFSKITIHADQPIQFQPSNEPSPDVPEQSPFQMLQEYLGYLKLSNEYVTIESLDIRAKEFQLLASDGKGEPLIFGLMLIKPASTGADVAAIDVTMKSKEMSGGLKGTLSAVKMGTADPFLTASVDFTGYKMDTKSALTAVFQNDILNATLAGPFRYQNGGKWTRIDPKLTLRMDQQNAELNLVTPVADIPGPLVKLDRVQMSLITPLQDGMLWSEQPSRFSVNGPVELFFIDKDMRPPLEQSCQCKVPERLEVKINGQLWLKTLLADSVRVRRPAFEIRAGVEGVKNRLFSLSLAGSLNGFREGTVYTYEPQLDSEIHIHSFKGLKKFLDAKNILIPAPFDVLDGTIDITAKGPVARDEKGTRTPILMKTALASEHQRVKLDSEVTVALDPKFSAMDVFFKLNIEDFTVELPPLDPVAGVPKMARDSRVQVAPPAPAAPSKFKLSLYFEAKTVRNGAIRLLSKLAKPNIPITVNIQRAMNGELTGNFQVEPFDINYLRRTVHVEQMRIVMDGKDSADFPVDGRFRVDQTQYRIFVDVSGTLRSPSIRLSSEPDLPRNEIISVLLYDRTSDQLVSADAETAGSFEAAMADRAIGLFGLWALSSTPIRSFSYNSVTKVYSASVQLADGVSAGIGTDWEEAAQLEVRKRVSKRWVLTASYSPSETDKERVGKVTLQWEKRF